MQAENNHSNVNNIGINHEKKNEKRANDDSSPQLALTISQRKKLRRGYKSKRTGQRKSRIDMEAILLGNLPPFYDTVLIENMLEQFLGLTKNNCFFYIEILRHPGQLSVEALIKFMDRRHTLFAFEKFQSVVVALLHFPLVVSFQNRFKPGYRLDDEFHKRYEEHMDSIKANLKKRAALYKRNMKNIGTNNKLEENKKAHTISDIPEESAKKGGPPNIDKSPVCNVAEIITEKAQKEILNNHHENTIMNEDSGENALHLACIAEQFDKNLENSNDSIDTVVLEKQTNDDMISLKLEPTDDYENLTIKQEPTDILHTTDVEKQKPKHLDYNQIQNTKNEVRNTDIIKIFDTFDPTKIDIKKEPVEILEIDDDNDEVIKDVKDISAPNKNGPNSTVPNEAIRTLSERDEVNKRPTKIYQTPVNRTTLSKKTPFDISYSTYYTNQTSVNEVSNELDNRILNDVARSSDSEKSPVNKSQGSTLSSPTLEVDESDATHCKIMHIKNLPITTDFHLKQIIRYEMLAKIYKNMSEVEYDVIILYDEVEDYLLGEALLRLSTHIEAARACHLLNGAMIADNIIEVKLDIGHKITKDHMKIANNRINGQILKRRRKRKNDGKIYDESPPHKKSKVESELMSFNFDRKYLPPEEHNMKNDYGFKPELLRHLKLKLPLSNTIIVKDLHELVDEDKLYEVFSMAGEIKYIQFNEKEHKARIEYDHPVEAVQALHIFNNKKLFDKNFDIEMHVSHNPRPLPIGLSGVNRGLNGNSEVLKGVRSYIQLREVHEILHELGKVNQIECKNSKFKVVYKRLREQVSKSLSTSSPSSTEVSITNNSLQSNECFSSEIPTVNNISSTVNNKNSIQSSGNQSQAIEALGSILIARGLIPTDTDCKDARNILVALQLNSNNHNIMSNSNNKNCTFVPPPFIQHVANLPPSFAHLTNAMAIPKQAVVSPVVVPPIPSSEPVPSKSVHHGNSHSSTTNVMAVLPHREKTGPEDYPNDPRVDKGISAEKIKESYRLIFRNLPPSVSQAALTRKLNEVGELLYCEMTGVGSAIVAFKTLEDANRCLRLFHWSKVDGQIIEVIFVYP